MITNDAKALIVWEMSEDAAPGEVDVCNRNASKQSAAMTEMSTESTRSHFHSF